jgi:hypothetical protein
MRRRDLRADFNIINYKYTIGGVGFAEFVGLLVKVILGEFELDFGGCKLWNV